MRGRRRANRRATSAEAHEPAASLLRRYRTGRLSSAWELEVCPSCPRKPAPERASPLRRPTCCQETLIRRRAGLLGDAGPALGLVGDEFREGRRSLARDRFRAAVLEA